MSKIFLLAAMIIFSSIPAFAQGFLAAPAQRSEVWICPGAETALYSSSGISAGASLAVAYGSKFAVGFKAAWFFDSSNEMDALELNILLRYYFTGSAALSGESATPSSGPYLQLTGGPTLFFDNTEGPAVPAHWGTVSAGLTFGWWFLLGKLFFTELYIRAGYPYIVGVGASGGVRF